MLTRVLRLLLQTPGRPDLVITTNSDDLVAGKSDEAHISVPDVTVARKYLGLEQIGLEVWVFNFNPSQGTAIHSGTAVTPLQGDERHWAALSVCTNPFRRACLTCNRTVFFCGSVDEGDRRRRLRAGLIALDPSAANVR